MNKSCIRTVSIALALLLSACQNRDEERSKNESEKNAKVRRAMDNVAASADHVITQGIKSAEEMKREIVQLATQAEQKVSSVLITKEDLHNAMASQVDGFRSSIEDGKEAILAQANSAARTVERSTRSKRRSPDPEPTAEVISGDGKMTRF